MQQKQIVRNCLLAIENRLQKSSALVYVDINSQ